MHLSPLRVLFIGLLAGGVGAAPVDADARRGGGSTLEKAKFEAAAGVAEAAAHAVLRAAMTAHTTTWITASADAAQSPQADTSLFVGPFDAWIVASAHGDLDSALEEAAALQEAGVQTDVIRTYDGGYEVALGAARFAEARQALKSWRRVGVAGPTSRLSDGSHYYRMVWSAADPARDPGAEK